MKRVLIVPAAGRGSRLSASLPKLLVPVGGRPMIDLVLDLYARVVDRAIVIVSPAAEVLVRKHFGAAELKFGPTGGGSTFGPTGGGSELGATRAGVPVDIAVQAEPTGMLDAILTPVEHVEALGPDWVWVTWCDQVAIGDATVERLVAAEAPPAPALSLATARLPQPYVHLVRDGQGRIVGVLQEREGDVMPESGEADSGLFAMSFATYVVHLPAFAVGSVAGAGTGERNFLPFVPWMAGRGLVRTVPVGDAIESVGINTPADLQRVEAHLAARSSPDRAAAPTRHS
jgi:bifunctional UDP-N-acetylglucosamine pyrophosphorylase / glucosamine-1-phosphate N-acetyltransferase